MVSPPLQVSHAFRYVGDPELHYNLQLLFNTSFCFRSFQMREISFPAQSLFAKCIFFMVPSFKNFLKTCLSLSSQYHKHNLELSICTCMCRNETFHGVLLNAILAFGHPDVCRYLTFISKLKRVHEARVKDVTSSCRAESNCSDVTVQKGLLPSLKFRHALTR